MVRAVLCDINGNFMLREGSRDEDGTVYSTNREDLPTCKRIANMGFEQSPLPGKAQ